jgi:hypothetical protein
MRGLVGQPSRGEPVGAYQEVAIRVGVRDRSVEESKERAPSTLVRRGLILPSADGGSQFHLLHVYIHPGAAQLIYSRQGLRANLLDVGRNNDDDLFTVIASARQRLPNCRVIARPAQDFDPGIIGKRRSVGEETDAVVPELAIGANDRSHCLGVIDRAERRLAHPHIIEGRMQMVETQDAHGRREMRNHGNVALAANAWAWSLRGTSHQSTSPLRSAAIAEN